MSALSDWVLRGTAGRPEHRYELADASGRAGLAAVTRPRLDRPGNDVAVEEAEYSARELRENILAHHSPADAAYLTMRKLAARSTVKRTGPAVLSV
ncbi:MAG TPA: hypothetical protein VGJ70_00795 [Solirubrobacteraceae bacterium]